VKDKICIVTGANSGIGKETAKALAARGARVVMVCRNEERGRLAQEEIIHKTGSDQVDLLLADLSSVAELKRLAETITDRYPQVDVLINNAGNFFMSRQLNNDGIEMTFAVNYLAPFMLSNLLLPNLKASGRGRIIIVSSRNQSFGKFDLENYDFSNRLYNGLQAYANSKLMTVIFTREMARRLKETNITINAAHPGDVVTNIGMHDNNWFFKMIWRLKCMFNVPVEKGAETPIYLATAPEIETVSGHYFAKKKIARHNPVANREGIGEELWTSTEALIRERTSIPVSEITQP
jgi:NAD(P)-dependent dehydrogenase (short-subunit alcohol dehydrogenase family)